MSERYHAKLDNDAITNQPNISVYLNDLSSETTARAFYNTSHYPERRGLSVRVSYANELINDNDAVIKSVKSAIFNGAEVSHYHESIIENWFVGHRLKLKDCYNTWLYSHSKVASSFITGGSNFPVERNKKKSNAADNKYALIQEFRKSSVKHVLKILLPFGDGTNIFTDDPRATNKLQLKIDALVKEREQMKAINSTVRKYFKNNLPDNDPKTNGDCIVQLVTLYKITQQQAEQLITPNYIGRIIPYETWELSNLGANIKRLKSRVLEVEQVQTASINDEFENGVSVDISTDQKICIHFGFKPSEYIRQQLKRHAFKWSPTRTAWVRKLTTNAEAVYFRDIKPFLAVLEKSA